MAEIWSSPMIPAGPAPTIIMSHFWVVQSPDSHVATVPKRAVAASRSFLKPIIKFLQSEGQKTEGQREKVEKSGKPKRNFAP